MLVLPSDSQQLLLSCNYDETGLAWVDIFDNPLLGWIADETGAAEVAPVVVGLLPPASVDTSPVLSPRWAHCVVPSVYVPDLWRGDLNSFFTWLATNNGAQRLVRGNFRNPNVANAMMFWASNNIALFNPEPFTS